MAVHTSAHRDIRLFRELRPLSNRAMAVLTGISAGQMRSMTEVHETGDLIHPHPSDLAVVLARMTLAAHLRSRQGHRFARIGIRMAGRALQFQVARMKLMAVGNGLSRRVLRECRPAGQQQNNQKLQRLPFRISSAM